MKVSEGNPKKTNPVIKSPNQPFLNLFMYAKFTS
jgi:hypothetical protein